MTEGGLNPVPAPSGNSRPPAYRRVLLKLSGEALMGDLEYGTDPERVQAIAREVAAPISAIDQLTVISTDGAGALPKQVTGNVVQTLAMLRTTTGLDLEGLIKRTVEGAVGATGGVVAGATTTD